MHAGPVHLVNPLWEACGGSEWRTVETWRLVAAHADARLWSEYEPAASVEMEGLIAPIRLTTPSDKPMSANFKLNQPTLK